MTDSTEQREEGETHDGRHDRRIAGLPSVYKRADERMAVELCMLTADADPWVVMETYGYTRDEALARLQSPGFAQLLAATRKQIDEDGLGFKAKVRSMAEALLPEAFEIATDPLASAAVRADIIKWAAKVAGYEPKDKDAPGAGAGGLNLHITFAGAEPQIVSRQPITIEAER